MAKKLLIAANTLIVFAFIGVLTAFAQVPDTTPPAITGVSASGIAQTGATVNWTTDEAADGQVEYGTSTAYGLSTTLMTATTTAHSIPLTGLTASTTYHYLVKSKDVAGNLATSTDYTFTTLAPVADTTAPVISGVAASAITPTSAVIQWTTNESADSQVEYGTSTAYGIVSALQSATTTAHSVSLGSLTASTTYHYLVKSKDVAGNLATSTDYTFTTLAPTATTTAAVAVKVKVEPRTLNTKTKGKWIEAEVAFPKGYNASQLDIASIRLNGVLAPVKVKVKKAKWYGSFTSRKTAKVEMKFSRADVTALLSAPTATSTVSTATSTVPTIPLFSLVKKEVTISGNVGADTFSGTTTIRVLIKNVVSAATMQQKKDDDHRKEERHQEYSFVPSTSTTTVATMIPAAATTTGVTVFPLRHEEKKEVKEQHKEKKEVKKENEKKEKKKDRD